MLSVWTTRVPSRRSCAHTGRVPIVLTGVSLGRAMGIVWTDKAREAITRRTRAEVPPFKPGKPETIWAAIRKSLALRNKYDPIDGTFVKGRTLTTPELAKLMEKCEAIARSTDAPSFEDVDVAASFIALLDRVANGQARALLLATSPVPFVFEAQLRSRDFDVTPHYTNWNDPFRLIAAPPDAPSQLFDAEWRNILLAQPDEVRSACQKIAKSFVARSPNLIQRTTIAFAFFEDSLGNDVARAWLATGKTRNPKIYAMVTDFELARQLVMKKDGSWLYFDLIETFGDKMLPLLVELAANPFDRWHCRNIAEALAVFDDPVAATAMVKLLNQASSRPHALSYFGKFPHHAEAALAAIDGMKGRAAKIAREVLAGAQRALASAVPAEDEASPDELPVALRNPPWLDDKKPKKPVTKLALVRVDVPERVDWQPGERERAIKLFPRPDKPASEETLAEYAKQRADGKFVDVVKHKNEALPDELVLEAWNVGQKTYGGTLGQKVQHVLAKFGDAAFPGLEHFVSHLANGWGDASFMTRVVSWRVVLPFAHHIAHRRIGKLAWAWLQKHSELAVITLVPVAFGDDADARADAERALFRLKATGVDVIGIGSRYGKQAQAALEKLFSWDPLYDLPKTMPKLGPSWHPETLTRPKLLNGKALPLAALDTIAMMLAFSPLNPAYAGLTQVKEACEPRSLAELSWDAARAWEHAGHKKKEIWMLMSLVHFADDEVVRRLTPGVRVDFAVNVLEVIGTDAALMEMATIAGRTQSQGAEWTLGGRIEKLLEAAAEARGVTKDELEEDLAPTTDLEEDGTLTLDYGSRKLQVGFDERLEPYVKTESGGRSRAVPPARKDDDPVKVERAKMLWRDLKEDVSVIGARRIKALERAMSTGRTWPIERFRRVWLEHRLMKHLARGVVWTDGKTAFRVAEDGSLSNVDDAPYTLADNAKIGVAHPRKLPPADVAKWCSLFEDYKLMQSFPQVGRQYVTIDAAATRLPWPYATPPADDFLTRIQLRGFKRGPYLQGKYTYQRELATGGVVHLELKREKEGMHVVVVFTRDGKEVPASDLDAIELGDVIYELQS